MSRRARRWGGALVALAVLAVALLGASSGVASITAPTAYVTNGDSASVTPINLTTGLPLANIGVGLSPFAVAINPAGTKAYVTNQASDSVSVIDTSSGSVIDTIGVGLSPAGIAITPDGSKAYVANPSSDTVSVIDLSNNGVTATLSVGSLPTGIAISPDGKTAYVTSRGDFAVRPINVATGVSGTPTYVGFEPSGIAITPNGQTAYVVVEGDDVVAPIDLSSNTLGALIPVGHAPRGIAITPDGQRAFVSNVFDDSVSQIDLSTNTVIRTVPVGAFPQGVAVSSDGKTAYVANTFINNVTPIAVSDGVTATSITTGFGPVSIGVFPDQAPVAAFSFVGAGPGLTSSFDGSASTASVQSPGGVVNYDWNFGDGTTATTSDPTTTHTFSASGAYNVSLTVTDANGCSTLRIFTGQTLSCNGSSAATVSHTVTVDGAPSPAPAIQTQTGSSTPASTAASLVSPLTLSVEAPGFRHNACVTRTPARRSFSVPYSVDRAARINAVLYYRSRARELRRKCKLGGNSTEARKLKIVQRWSFDSAAGSNNVKISLSKKKIGRYTLEMFATDSLNQRSKLEGVKFVIVPPKF